ncbi:hypothetical protein SVIOM74S_09795 [Streptomyces violarus]
MLRAVAVAESPACTCSTVTMTVSISRPPASSKSTWTAKDLAESSVLRPHGPPYRRRGGPGRTTWPQLPGLLAVLPRSWGRISSVLVHGDTWLDCPEHLDVAGQEVHVGRRDSPITPDTVYLPTPGRGRWDLLAVPPATTETEAVGLMERAVAEGE